MAATEEVKKEKIPDTYSLPEWLTQRCCRNAKSSGALDSQLDIEEVESEPATAEADKSTSTDTKTSEDAAPSTNEADESLKPESVASSGRSSVVIVESEQTQQLQQADTAQASADDHETETASQATITAGDSGPVDPKEDVKLASDAAASKTPTIPAASLRQKISRSFYDSLHDSIAPALRCSHQLLAFERPPTVAVSVINAEELPLADAVVLQLAQDFKARTIFLDAEDVEDLAWDFDKQQKSFDKIEKDQKAAERAKKVKEREEKIAEREKKKVARAARKAEMEKKEKEEKEKKEKEEKEEKEKEEKEKEEKEKEAASAAGSAEPTNAGDQTDGDAKLIEHTAEHSADAATSTVEKSEDKDRARSTSDAAAQTVSPDAAKSEVAAEPLKAGEKSEETQASPSPAHELKKDESKSGDSTEEKKDEESDTEDLDVEEPEIPSDSENDDFDGCINNYWGPCETPNLSTGYNLTKIYFGGKGNTDRTKKIFKRGRAALTTLLQNMQEVAKPVEDNAADKTIEDSAACEKKLETVETLAVSTKTDEQATDKPMESVVSGVDASAQPAELKAAEDDAAKLKESLDVKPTTELKPDPEPLIVCVRDVNTIMAEDNGEIMLAQLGNLITVCREGGQRAIMIITFAEKLAPFKDNICPCGYPCCGNSPKKMERMLKWLKIDESAKIALVKEKSKDEKEADDNKADDDKDEQPEAEQKSRRQYAGIRRMKRYLRHGVAAGDSKEWFDAGADWQTDNALEKLRDKEWDDTRVRRAARQVLGRAATLGAFEFEDVLRVVERLDREAEPKDGDDDKDKSEAAKAFEKKLEKVKGNCNSHEERLLESVVKPGDLESTYADVIIDEDTKEAVKQLITLFKFKATSKSKKLLKLLNISGAMFYGPPGTGKTHLCKAMANDYGACMLALEASTLQDMWVGETEKLIKAAFTLATKLHPCILFIDEADSLFRRRSTSDKSWERNALTMYLQQMDGIGTNDKRPFVVVATNRPSDLDDAFLRRLPHKVLFSLPSETHRAAILKLFLADEDLENAVDVADIAKQTRGLSGSDLKSLCGQAVLAWATEHAVKADSSDAAITSELKLTSAHFKTALKRTRPTVSRQALADVDSFARQYDSSRF